MATTVSTGQLTIVDTNDGQSVAEISVYARKASTPNTPTGGAYNFTTGVITVPTGADGTTWYTVPADAGTTGTLYISRARATYDPTKQSTTLTTWTTPVQFAGNNGQDAKALFVTATSNIFYLAKEATTLTPASIVITANKQNLPAGNITWTITGGVTGTASGTDNTIYTITNIQFGNNNNSITVTATFNTYSDSITIYKYDEALDVPFVSMSNSTHELDADATGAIYSFAGSGSTFTVREGNTALIYDAAATPAVSTYKFGTPTTVVDTGSITIGVLSSTGLANITAMTANTATITIPVIVKRANGNTVTINVDQTVVKKKRAATLNLSATKTSFKYLANNNRDTSDTATSTITLAPANIQSTSTWYYTSTKDAGVESARTAVTAATTTVSYTADDAYANMPDNYTFKVYDASSGGNLLATASIIMNATKVGDTGNTGNSAALFRITNTGAVFVKKKDGTFAPTNIVLNTTYQNITGTITYQWYKNDVVISGATSSSYTVPTSDYSAVSSNTYKCVITGTINGVAGSTLNDSIVIPKQDEATENPSILVSDSSIIFTAPNTGYAGISFTSGSVEITAYIGSTKCDFAASGANTFSVGTLVLSGVTGVTGSGNTTTDVYTVSAPTAMSADSAYVDVPITIRGPAGTSVYSANTRITYSLSRTGGTGGTGPSGRNAVKGYQKLVLTSMPSAPAVPNSSTTDPRTAGAVANAGVWYTNPPTSLATNEWLFEMDGFYDGTTYTWTSPSYLSTFKVGKLEALTVNTGSLTVDGDVVVGTGGTIKSSGYSPGSDGWAIKNDGTAEFAASSIRGKITATQIDSTNLSIKDANGNVILAAGTPLDSANYYSIYNYDFTAQPANTLIAGRTYIIETSGTTSWTSLGSSSNAKDTIFVATGAQSVTPAGSFSVGTTYDIVTVGTTDFTAIGSNTNKVGARFTATGTGTGNGTAIVANVGMAIDLQSWQKVSMNVYSPNTTSETSYLRTTSTTNDPQLYNYTVNFKGKDYDKVRARVRRRTTGAADLTCFYRTLGGHVESSSYLKVIPDTTVLDQWVVLEWDMANLTVGGTDWKDSIITGIRIDLANASEVTFDVDWISIGRYGPLNVNSSNADTYISNLTIGTLKFQEDAVSDSIQSVYTNAVIYNSATGVSSTSATLSGPVITPVSNKAFVIWFNGAISQINGAYQVNKNVFSAITATARLINVSKSTTVDIITQKQQIPVPESQSYENSFSVSLAGIYENIIPKDVYRLDIFVHVALKGTYLTDEAAITSVKFTGLGQIQEVKV